MTKREMYVALKSIVSDVEVAGKDELLKGLDHEIELLDKKKTYKSDKPTETQRENEAYKAEILRVLGEADAPMTIKAIKAKSEALSALEGSQRVSALMTQLGAVAKGEPKADALVKRVEIKKVAHYALA